MSNDLETKLRALHDEAEPYWPDGYPFALIDLLKQAAALGAAQAADRIAQDILDDDVNLCTSCRMHAARAAASTGSGES